MLLHVDSGIPCNRREAEAGPPRRQARASIEADPRKALSLEQERIGGVKGIKKPVMPR